MLPMLAMPGVMWLLPCCIVSMHLRCHLQPTWWDESDTKNDSSSKHAQTELPVSSNAPHGGDDLSSTKHDAKAGQQPSTSSASDPAPQAAPSPASLQDVVASLQTSGPWTDCTGSSSKRPPPRYEHAAAIVGRQLFIVGGNCGNALHPVLYAFLLIHLVGLTGCRLCQRVMDIYKVYPNPILLANMH